MNKLLFIISALLLVACTDTHDTLIFLSKDTGVSRIYEIKPNNEIAIISLNRGKAVNPALSPDGKKLAYLSEELGAWDVRVRYLNSIVDTNITRSAGLNGTPSWSADGNFLAYMGMTGDNRDIFVYDFQTGEERQVTFSPAIDVAPIWSLNIDDVLYFQSLRSGNEEIYQLSVTDSLVRKISPGYGGNSKVKGIPGQNSMSYIHYNEGKYKLLSFSESSHETIELLYANAKIQDYDWSAEGQYLALDFAERIEIYVQNDTGMEFLESIPFGELPKWSRKNNTLFYNLNDAQGAQIFKYNLDNNEVEEMTPIDFNAYQAIPVH